MMAIMNRHTMITDRHRQQYLGPRQGLAKRRAGMSAQRLGQVCGRFVFEPQQVVAGDAAVLQRRDQPLPARRIQPAGRADDAVYRVWLTAVVAGFGDGFDAFAATAAQQAGIARIAAAAEANARRQQLFEAAAEAAQQLSS